jgi:hypothetical protein
MNDMETNPQDKQVIDLLSKLKNSSGAYPSDILASRRQNYLKQVANVGLGIGVGAGLKSGSGAGTAATATSKVLETALIVAIALEAGTVAYLYREKIADAVRSYTGSSNVQEIASPANDASSQDSELVEATEFPVVIVTTPSGTVTAPSVTISGSASPDVAGGNNNNNGANVNATPNPGGNNGNQYGLTPKPVRTIENNDNGGGGNGGGNDGDNGGGNGGGNGNSNRP